MRRVRLDAARIVDSRSFHAEFASHFGFPSYYGANMDAWIDCMSCLREPETEMSTISVGPTEQIVLELAGSADFSKRCPREFKELVDCCDLVNERLADRHEPPLLVLELTP